MIDLINETVVTLNEATKKLPRRRAGKRVHVATLHRWASAGSRGVTLETIRVGGTLCTSLEALQRFCDRCTYASAPISPTTTRARQKRMDQAERELTEAGI